MPTQYASTTRGSSGSAMPFAPAISVRYGHAPSNVRASCAKPAVRLVRGAVLEQRPRLVGAAEPERVRRVRVAREQERPGGHDGAPRATGRRSDATAATRGPGA